MGVAIAELCPLDECMPSATLGSGASSGLYNQSSSEASRSMVRDGADGGHHGCHGGNVDQQTAGVGKIQRANGMANLLQVKTRAIWVQRNAIRLP
jgi:hypothetical protein